VHQNGELLIYSVGPNRKDEHGEREGGFSRTFGDRGVPISHSVPVILANSASNAAAIIESAGEPEGDANKRLKEGPDDIAARGWDVLRRRQPPMPAPENGRSDESLSPR